MSVPSEQIIHIHWEGPLGIDSVTSRTAVESDRASLYQVYGTYASFTSPVLLYIGRTYRDAPDRLLEHEWIIGTDYTRQVSDSQHVELYMGTVYAEKAVKNQNALIDQCEALLIFAHKPVLNVMAKNKVPKYQGIRVFNWLDYRNLMPELSDLRWSGQYWGEGPDLSLVPVAGE